MCGWPTIWLLAVALASTHIAAAQTVGDATAYTRERSRLLDVPYVPQSEELCGGAAVAMVFRYWGSPAVYAEDFAALVDRSAGGISLATLVTAVEQRGWNARSFAATPADVQQQLAQGRPVVALIEVRPGRLHYVVVVAWARDRVVYHDPAINPFRITTAAEFVATWRPTQFATLLIMPPAGATTNTARDRTGGASVRDRAGELFAQKRWREAADVAALAVENDPADLPAWQLLAASRFLDGDLAGALAAWNRRGEPRVDLIQVDGLQRTRHAVVANLVGLPPQSLLTSGGLGRAVRRVASLPSAQLSRVSYSPRENGTATIEAAILERPLIPQSRTELLAAAVYAATAREAKINVASPTGNGELWTASARWWPGRPRFSASIQTPSVGPMTGLATVAGLWERQSIAYPASAAIVTARAGGDRRRASFSFSDWVSEDLRWEGTAALDRWSSRGHYVGVGFAMDRRRDADRVSLQGAVTVSPSLAGESAFAEAVVATRWRASTDVFTRWAAHVGLHAVTARTPLELWPGPDTGVVRPSLLRAHPLLDGGAIQASRLARGLVNGTIEFQQPMVIRPFAQIAWAAFADAAMTASPIESGHARVHLDLGGGLRVRLPVLPGVLRIDLARGVRDGVAALSFAWQPAWPGS